ncbi:MAG: hypothetical protein MI923_08530 [Phycisphaerales bacterium]|nr:hypothetical protein [Phycisphaerales bacterium]
MMLQRPAVAFLVFSFSFGLASDAVMAVAASESELYKAYYLEKERKEFAKAKEIYDKIKRAGIQGDLGSAAKAGSARCRDHLAARNFARLMPEDTLVYVELNRPGEIIEKLADMLGLVGKPIREVLAARPSTESAAPLHIPSEITISPSLLDALGSFGGAALAVTDIDFADHRPPTFVLVLHHGDVELLKGVLETMFQFTPTAEKIGDLPTFGHAVPEIGQITGVLTESLLVISNGRNLVEGVVDRLAGSKASSLASRNDLKDLVEDRSGSTVFACANLQGLFELSKANVRPHDREDFDVVNAFADLESLRWATFSAGIDDGILGARFTVRLAENHRSIAYNMMRLPPMRRTCLKHVPPDAAALLGIGLNPTIAQATLNAAEGRADNPNSVTAFDIGREFFGNIQEICAFVVPGNMRAVNGHPGSPPVPNIGVLFAVNDVAKSKALWNQILTIPGLVSSDEPVKPKLIKISRLPATAYAISDFGKIYMAELDGCIAIGLTRNALKATIRASQKKKSILDDDIMGKIIVRMPTDSSIMVAAHIGRLAEVACGAGEMEVKVVAKPVSQLCKNTVAWFGLGQSPNELTVQSAVSGLPNVNDALRQFGPILNTAVGVAAPRQVVVEIAPEPTSVVEERQ